MLDCSISLLRITGSDAKSIITSYHDLVGCLNLYNRCFLGLTIGSDRQKACARHRERRSHVQVD